MSFANPNFLSSLTEGLSIGFFGCGLSAEVEKDVMMKMYVVVFKLHAPDVWSGEEIEKGFVMHPADLKFDPDQEHLQVSHKAAVYQAAKLSRYFVTKKIPHDDVENWQPGGDEILSLFREMLHTLVTDYVDESIGWYGTKPFAGMSNMGVE